MLDGSFSNPKLSTLTKVADFCNASIDEILGRDPKYYSSRKQTFNPVNANSITEHLLEVVTKTMANRSISAYQLSRQMHVDGRTLDMFLDPNVSATHGAATNPCPCKLS